MAATSDYFHNIIMEEKSKCVLDFVDSKTLDEIIRFCYVGKIQLSVHNLKAIIVAAHKLKLEKLKMMCSDYLDSIDDDKSLQFALVAEKCGLKVSKGLAKKLFANNCSKIFASEQFKQWNQSQFDDFVKNLLKKNLFTDLLEQIQSNEYSIMTTPIFSKDLFQAIFKSFVCYRKNIESRENSFKRLLIYISFI